MSSKNPQQVVLTQTTFPAEIPVISILERPAFPGMIIPLLLSEPHKEKVIEYATAHSARVIGLILRKDEIPSKESSYEDGMFSIGTAGRLIKPEDKDDGPTLVDLQKRFKVQSFRTIKESQITLAKVEYYDPSPLPVENDTIKAYLTAITSKIKELIKLNPLFSEEIRFFISRYGMREPEHLCDLVTIMLGSANPLELQEILETFDLEKRCEKVLRLIQKEIEISAVKEKINKQIEDTVSKQQRRFFLQEQLKYIKKELGLEKDEKTSELEKFKKLAKSLALSEEASKIVEEELEKLSYYDPRSSEYGVSRNYLQWICNLPWGIESKDVLEIDKVRKVLNHQHYGLEEVKERILEFVAIQKLKEETKGSIICFVGPPGVGKTTLGISIANALERKQYNFSLGGVRDEAEIKGHRRTYIGAMPGKIIQALKYTGTLNPVIILDEIDKMASGYRGDPSSSLLEILDPEQNKQFLDHYMDIHFDLSKVLFICTANQLDTIPGALLDRMEIVRLSGYLLEEKLEIAKKHLIPKLFTECGLDSKSIVLAKPALEGIISGYARESGVRTLQRQIQKIFRKIALKRAEGKDSQKIEFADENSLKEYLGLETFKPESLYESPQPGVISGLAWTSIGGTTMYIESILVGRMEGENSGTIKITGQMGSVMQESAQIAYSYVRSICPKLSIHTSFFQKGMIHLHVPEGATPKDGPSAGITMALSLVSLALEQSVPHHIAMTGELTVTGKVLPIGGVREKIIAAKRANKKIVLLPSENKRDFEELPVHVKKNIKVIFVNTFFDVLLHTLKKKIVC